MQKIPPRIIIYNRDVKNITGRKCRTCQTILQRVSALYNKGKNDLVTITEFCAYMRMDERLVREFLVD